MSFATLCSLAAVADQVSVTILKVNDTAFMAVIQPSLKLSEKYPQLASPVQVTAPADTLDAEVANAITSYRPALESAINNIAQIEGELQAAQQAARDKHKPKGGASKPSASGTTTSASKPASPMTKVATPAPPGPPDLFGAAPSPAPQGQSSFSHAEEPGDDEEDDGDAGNTTQTSLMALGE